MPNVREQAVVKLNELTDEELESRLYSPVRKINQEQRGEIDWAYINKELKRKHVTLMLLWGEYKSQHPQGVGYSQFCNLYRDWAQQLEVWMRQPHKAGEKLFVDYAGQTVFVVCNSSTGELAEAQIFVATLGASNYTYVEATWTQTLPDWIQSHVNAFEFFGGCPEIIVNDYVPRHIIWVMFPSVLCGLKVSMLKSNVES